MSEVHKPEKLPKKDKYGNEIYEGFYRSISGSVFYIWRDTNLVFLVQEYLSDKEYVLPQHLACGLVKIKNPESEIEQLRKQTNWIESRLEQLAKQEAETSS